MCKSEAPLTITIDDGDEDGYVAIVKITTNVDGLPDQIMAFRNYDIQDDLVYDLILEQYEILRKRVDLSSCNTRVSVKIYVRNGSASFTIRDCDDLDKAAEFMIENE